MKLKGKIAIVTGGSRGIGKAIAEEFLKQGAAVMLAARSESELAAAKNELVATASAVGGGGDARVEICVADVSKAADAARLVAATVQHFGGLDILVNAAGVYGAIGAVASVDAEEWKRTFEINLFGAFNMIQAALPAMGDGTPASRKKIINFSGGGDGPLPNFSAYSTSKIAVVRLTETLAVELGPRMIDVNAIAPGPVNTKILEDALAAGESVVGPEMYAKFLKQKEEGGVGPEKAAALCAFLASSDADGLTGRLVSAIWDNYSTWTKTDIEHIMKDGTLVVRRVNL